MAFLFGHFVVAVLLPAGCPPARVSPVSGLTLSAASVSGTDAEAISGAFAVADLKGGISAADFLMTVFMVALVCGSAIIPLP
jgi:hypothetical protein